MVFTNHDLFEACVAARVPGMTYEIYAQVWDAMCRWIHYTVDECGHGVNMPQFIKITWAGSQYKDKDTTARDSVASAASSPAKKGPGFNPYVRRPHVLLHEAFLEQYNVRFRRPAELPMAKCEDLNCIKVAIKYGQTNGPQKLTKDLVSSALKRIVSKMGEMFQAGTDLEISFAVGRLFGRNGQGAFLMEAKYVPEGLELRSAANGNPFNPLPSLPHRPRESSGSCSHTAVTSLTPRTLAGRGVASRSLPSRATHQRGSSSGGRGESVNQSGRQQVLVPPATPASLRMLLVNTKAGESGSLKVNERYGLPPLPGARGGGTDNQESAADGSITPGARRRIDRWLNDQSDRSTHARMHGKHLFPPVPHYSDRPATVTSSVSSWRPLTGSTSSTMAAIAADVQRRFNIKAY